MVNKRTLNTGLREKRKIIQERLNEVREALILQNESPKHTSKSATRWNARYRLDNLRLQALQCGKIPYIP